MAAADAELNRLETAAAAIAANLVELDENPFRKDLDRTRLTGRTATAWADAGEALAKLWDQYRMLTDVIGRARALRGQRRLSDADRARFTHEVLGKSITLSSTTIPLAQRSLLSTGQITTTCSPAELLAAMEASFANAVTIAVRSGETWQRLLPAAADAAAALDHARELARRDSAATASATALLAEADRLLGELTGVLATDPLAADEQVLTRVRALIDRADAERTSAAELRESLHQRLAAARALAAEIASAAQAADAARQAAAGRFPDHQIVVVRGPDLRADLAAIEALAAAGQWALISPRLAAWTRQARELLAAQQQATARNAALLADRNELRGRLDAYRAKALRRGLGEHPRLTPLAEAARAALHTAPCDLRAARAAVDAYQDALSATIARSWS